MKLIAAGVTHVGMKRTKNQDGFLVDPELTLFVVADGSSSEEDRQSQNRLEIPRK